MIKISEKVKAIAPSLTLAISARAKEMKAAGADVINFGVGEPDFNTPEHIVQAAKTALDKGYTKYVAASGLPELKKAESRQQFRVRPVADYNFKRRKALHFQRRVRVHRRRRRSAYSQALLADLSRNRKKLRRRSRVRYGYLPPRLQGDGFAD